MANGRPDGARDPRLVRPILDAVDADCKDPKRGGIRNRTKTHVIIYATPQQIQHEEHTWNTQAITKRATLNTPTDELRSLSATIGGKEHRRKTFKARLRAMHVMHHKLATINDPVVKLQLAKHCQTQVKCNTAYACTAPT